MKNIQHLSIALATTAILTATSLPSYGAKSGAIGLALTNDSVGLNYATRYGRGEVYIEGFTDTLTDDTYANIGFRSETNQSTIRKPRATLEMKSYIAHIGAINDEVLGIALGGGYTYFFNTQMPLMVQGTAFYGPNILTANGGSYMEGEAKLGVEIMPDSRAYLGYRKINMDVDKLGDHDLMGHLFVGIDLAF